MQLVILDLAAVQLESFRWFPGEHWIQMLTLLPKYVQLAMMFGVVEPTAEQPVGELT
jgi:hypothetical protein